MMVNRRKPIACRASPSTARNTASGSAALAATSPAAAISASVSAVRAISTLDQQLDAQPIGIVDEQRVPIAALHRAARDGDPGFVQRRDQGVDRRVIHRQTEMVDLLRRAVADQLP